MSRRRLSLTFLVVLLVAAGVVGAGWWLWLRPLDVRTIAAARDVPVQIFGLGTVEARVTSRVGFKVSGVLKELHADLGDRVASGTVLARLDFREQQARLGRAQAGVAQTQASILRAEAGIERAQAAYANAVTTSERRQALLARHDVSTEAAEAAKAAMDITRAELDVARSDLAVARAAAADARASAQLEEVTLDLHTLTAPYDAVVLARLKEPGSALAAGEAVFTLIDPTTVWVLAYVDEGRAGGLRVGQPAQIVLRSAPKQRLAGHIARIQIESDRVNEERRVEIAFDRIPDDFHIGEQTEVFITTGILPYAVLAPDTALDGATSDHATVWTLEDGHLARREVGLGARLLDGRREMTTGLPEGVGVLAVPPARAWEGRSAKVVTGTAAAP